MRVPATDAGVQHSGAAVEFLDLVIAVIRDEDIAGGVDRDRVRVVETVGEVQLVGPRAVELLHAGLLPESTT